MGMGSALIHRARVRRQMVAAEANELGEREVSTFLSPWFKARLLEPRGGGPESREADTGASRERTRYEVLADLRDETGAEVEILSSDQVEVAAPVMTGSGTWLLTVDGKPEFLNTGRKRIGWDVFAVRAEHEG